MHTNSPSEHSLSKWLESHAKTHYSLVILSASQLNALFGLLPTRGRRESRTLRRLSPRIGQILPIGHHLGMLPDKYANSLLRPDGSPPWHAPPSPFMHKRWSGGSFTVSSKSPPCVGLKFVMKSIYMDSKRTDPEFSEHGKIPQTVTVRQRLILSQWYPKKTDLVVEERVTDYTSQPYDGSQIKTSSLIPPNTGIFSFAFTPTPSLLQAFSTFCEDTHRIHFDLEYAKSEGYPDLVVQVPLQLILVLDTMTAHMPVGMSFRAIDYRLVNPLFAGRKIKIYRQWIHQVDKDDDSPVTLADLTFNATPPVFQFGSEDASSDSDQIPPRARLRRQGRRARIKRLALLWTVTNDGTVGIVALVTLNPRVDKAFWTMDTTEGYLIRQEKPWDEEVQSTGSPRLSSQSSEVSPDEPSEPFPNFQEPIGFDSLGRPIPDNNASRIMSNTDGVWTARRPWALRDDDVEPMALKNDAEAMENERIERKAKAAALAKSRGLLGRMFKDDTT